MTTWSLGVAHLPSFELALIESVERRLFHQVTQGTVEKLYHYNNYIVIHGYNVSRELVALEVIKTLQGRIQVISKGGAIPKRGPPMYVGPSAFFQSRRKMSYSALSARRGHKCMKGP